MNYTFILDFRGGTFIEQVDASDVMAATHAWAKKVAQETAIQHLNGEAFLKVFYDAIEVFRPVAIDDCLNVWHLYFLLSRYELDIHIVKTSDAPEPANTPAASNARAGA